MRKLLLLPTLALLMSCDQAPPQGESGGMYVITTMVKTEEELRKHCPTDVLHQAQGLRGCSKGGALQTPASNVCRIYILEPKGFDDHRRVETLGHELMHCMKGPVHT